MSGSRPKPVEAHLAEQHLGDRLSALVDGELGHESRERVLAHLATCARCKAEADAQRRLKDVFAQAAPPPPSESFLARLQGLPGGGDADGGPPSAEDGPLGRDSGTGAFGVRRGERFEFGYVPAVSAVPARPLAFGERGFPVHPVGRPDGDRAASRGLRFAFAAAGAVSLAAVALGGMTGAVPGDTAAEARGGGAAGTVGPVRPAGTGGAGAATPDTQRRRPVAPLLTQGGLLAPTPVAPVSAAAPLLPGVSSSAGVRPEDPLHALTAPVMAGAAAVSALIRPLDETDLIAWAPAPDPAVGLLSVPVPTTAPAPASPPAPASASRRMP
ncbi:anti-sigma factor [Streptomyces sp. TG1A-8]|uniref:anti-sigma factor family protein n=1 Tax=Streptomyces sp. TG1A-8 TaxID=3051385 RepID=UPI00265BCE02|nr:anti-sigma factor [Streptomyces sp. TG1A-8]MDO0925861.1 anti-sigma factor [Streptomyces sp. TG1A-8]